jgi:hypothetical protein
MVSMLKSYRAPEDLLWCAFFQKKYLLNRTVPRSAGPLVRFFKEISFEQNSSALHRAFGALFFKRKVF